MMVQLLRWKKKITNKLPVGEVLETPVNIVRNKKN